MGRIHWLLCVASLAAVGATGFASSLYTDAHPGWWRFGAAHQVSAAASTKPLTQPEPVKARIPQRSAEQLARDAVSAATIRGATDEFLTGDVNGRAEWNAPDGGDNPTICGVTPEGRYIIKHNRYGVSRYDEPPLGSGPDFINAWGRLRCADTAPVNQARLISEQNREEHYKSTHPVNGDCLMAEIHAAASNTNLSDDPHYCRDGRYERDQTAQVKNAKP